MNTTPGEAVRQAIVEQACVWQARYLSGEMSAAEKVDFLKWLQDNPGNVRECLETVRMARLIPSALRLGPITASEHAKANNVVDLRASPASGVAVAEADRPRRLAKVFGLAAALALVCTLTIVSSRVLNDRPDRVYEVPHGDQRTVRLADGSLIHLNSNSRARVRYSAGERLIELYAGQGMFDVASEPRRPFRVRAGATEILAVGTQFDVYRRGPERVTVTVVEGRVQVMPARAKHRQQKPRAEDTASKPLLLSVGEQAQSDQGRLAVNTVDVSSATAWLRRELVFSGRPLREIAEEFNRYLSTPVYIDDAALRETRVSGIFSAYDAAAFIAFLRELEGAEVEVSETQIRVR